MSSILGYTMPTDTNKLLRDSACFTCMSDKQLMESLYSSMTQIINPTETRSQIGEKGKCLDCATEKQLKAAFVYLWCKLWSTAVTT